MKLHMGMYLCAKFEVSSIILTSVRQGEEGGGNFTSPSPQNEPLKNPPLLGLNICYFGSAISAASPSLASLAVFASLLIILDMFFLCCFIATINEWAR